MVKKSLSPFCLQDVSMSFCFDFSSELYFLLDKNKISPAYLTHCSYLLLSDINCCVSNDPFNAK